MTLMTNINMEFASFLWSHWLGPDLVITSAVLFIIFLGEHFMGFSFISI